MHVSSLKPCTHTDTRARALALDSELLPITMTAPTQPDPWGGRGGVRQRSLHMVGQIRGLLPRSGKLDGLIFVTSVQRVGPKYVTGEICVQPFSGSWGPGVGPIRRAQKGCVALATLDPGWAA